MERKPRVGRRVAVLILAGRGGAAGADGDDTMLVCGWLDACGVISELARSVEVDHEGRHLAVRILRILYRAKVVVAMSPWRVVDESRAGGGARPDSRRLHPGRLTTGECSLFFPGRTDASWLSVRACKHAPISRTRGQDYPQGQADCSPERRKIT